MLGTLVKIIVRINEYSAHYIEHYIYYNNLDCVDIPTKNKEY